MQTKLAEGVLVQGRWRLRHRLGEGADAVLFAADDTRAGRPVALKLLKASLDEHARARLRWEFAALAAIDHPHLVRVFDLDSFEGQPFFTAELLDASRPTRLAKLPVAARARAICQVLGEVASALEALHRRGIVHHDVKPSNLLADGDGRTRLGDFGLASLRGAAFGSARGTPGYLAPEAFCGDGDARVDLYALGATAYALWSGRPPFAAADLGALLQRLRSEAPPPLAGAPPELARLVARLLASDAGERPSSARAILDEARRLGARLEGALDAAPTPIVGGPAFAGREQALAAVRAAIAGARLVLVEGAAGSGKSRLIDEARRAEQLDDAQAGRPALAYETLGADSAARAARRLSAKRVLLHVTSVNEPRVAELLALAAHGAALPSVIVAEIEPGAHADLDGAAVVRVALAPLDEAATARLCRSMLGAAEAAFAAAVQRASGGNPRRAVAIVRAVAARASGVPAANDVRKLDGADLGALVAAAAQELPAPARALVDALAVLARPASLEELAELAGLAAADAFGAAGRARVAGIVEPDAGGALEFPSPAHAEAIYRAIPARQRKALHRRALARCPDADTVELARHRLALATPDAVATALSGGAELIARGRPRRALALLGAAAPRARGAAALRLGLLIGQARTQLSEYAGALATLAKVEAGPDRALALEATLEAARALQRAGDLAAAEARLDAVLAAAAPPALADRARGLYGRILITKGELARAAAICQAAAGASPAVDEARGLACLYLGRLDEAAAAFAAVEEASRDDAVARARACSLLGMVAQARDALPEAARFYQSALELARDGDDLHGAAVYASNVGAVLREQGEYARALAPTAEAARALDRLGKPAESAFARYNYGNLLLSIGDLDGAARAAADAAALAAPIDARRELGYARLLDGDLARRRGDLAAAIAAYREGERLFAGGAADDRLFAALNLAEALAEAGDAAAPRVLDEARALAAQHGDRWTLSAARVALESGAAVDARLCGELAAVAARATRALRRDLAFRAELLESRAHVRCGARRRALVSLARARTLWKEIRMRTPELRRESLDEDPDARRLRELLAAAGDGAAVSTPRPPASAVPEAAPLRRLIALNKRLNSELRLPVLLDLILDTVLELTSAERGFVLLTDGEKWRVEAERNIAVAEGQGRRADASAFSRSIAERAAKEGVPIVTVDANHDERFEAALSVADFKLRSVLAVPLAVKGRVVGCVYADHRLRAGAFGEGDVALVRDLAEQAAIAVENARLLAENERRRAEIQALNEELKQKVASQAVEIGALHKEVRSSRAALAVRYDYDNLVGKTPRMLELFRLLDRVTDTALPVVIYGESGTGKELVARAIHHNGPRRKRAFVSESCAAIPETLLEAALFGHVRGAFTGADSERRGLFEVADGGTLFLDEVGEMPAAMQVKLLRVLQESEFRRVGGEKTIKVNVRLVCASNRDLGRLVEEGRFREDLFYRLHVVRVGLPALRERRDDIPLLVEHFLRKFAADNEVPQKRIAKAALQKLVSYRWPGNVRELENEVARAASLGGDLIAVEDLSPHVIAGEPGAALDAPDDLTLKHRVERLERALLGEALQRAAGNQTQAARLLGLSRFGLQKKLRRYGAAPT